MRGRIVIAALAALVAACTGGSDEPLVEYPSPAGSDATSAPDGEGPDPTHPGVTPPPPTPGPEPVAGTKLWSEVTWIEGATTDGHLVMTRDRDLVVLPAGTTQPTVLAKDFDTSTDELVVRGRTVAMWLGDSVLPSAVTTWSPAGGVKANGPVSLRGALYAKPGSDVFAVRGKGLTAASSTLAVVAPGAATPTTIVPYLDNGAIQASCRPSIGWIGDDLLVGGCTDTNGGTTYRVALYATDGSGGKTILQDGAAPGVWPNHARTKAVVQTSSASTLRPLAGAGAAVPLDTAIRAAAFSDDDAKVLYLRADGKVRRASTTSPASPVDLASGAIMLLGGSPDTRFVAYATKIDASSQRTDVVLVDANAPASAKTLATEKAIFAGFSSDGSALVYQTTTDIGANGPLFVQPTNGAPAVKISDDAQRVAFDGKVVVFQEFDKTQKTNVLKAARIAQPAAYVLEPSVDPLTTHVTWADGSLFVASKLGLWSYPAPKP